MSQAILAQNQHTEVKTHCPTIVIPIEQIHKISKIQVVHNRYSLIISYLTKNYNVGFVDSNSAYTWKHMLKKEYNRTKYNKMNVVKFGNQGLL